MRKVQIPIFTSMNTKAERKLTLLKATWVMTDILYSLPMALKLPIRAWKEMVMKSDLDSLFVYDINDGKRTWITKGWDFDVENINWSDNQTIYFTCSHHGTSQVFKTDIAGKGVEQVTEGTHDLGPLNFKSGVLVSGLASMSMAPEVAVVNMTSGEVKQISSINKSIYESIKMGKVEEKYIKTKDNKAASDVDDISS